MRNVPAKLQNDSGLSEGDEMSNITKLALLCTATGLASCAIHPEPIDMTGTATVSIVKQIRCEMKSALMNQLVDTLQSDQESDDNKLVYTKFWGEFIDHLNQAKQPIGLADTIQFSDGTTVSVNQIVSKIEKDLPRKKRGRGKKHKAFNDSIEKDRKALTNIRKDGRIGINQALELIRLNSLIKNVKERIEKFLETGIAYTFKFTITESNDNTADATFTVPFTNGSFTLGLTAGTELERKNNRTFKIVENFLKYRTIDCSAQFEADVKSQPIYPISGNIGVNKVLDTFVHLVDLGSPVLLHSETLTYSTKVIAKVTPEIIMHQIPTRGIASNKARLTKGTLNSSNDRIDIHEVAIGLGLAPPKKPKCEREIPIGSDRSVRLVIDTPLSAGSGCIKIRGKKTVAKPAAAFSEERLKAARDAASIGVDRQQNLEILNRNLQRLQ